VFNNPLSYTDPTGFNAEFDKQLISLGVAILSVVLCGPACANAGIAAGVGAAVGAITGYVMTGTFKGAMQGAFSGAIFAAVGSIGNYTARVITSAVVGGDVQCLTGR